MSLVNNHLTEQGRLNLSGFAWTYTSSGSDHTYASGSRWDGKERKGVRPLSLCPQVSNWWEAERGDSFRQSNSIPCKGTPGIAHFLTENISGSTWNWHRSLTSLHDSCSHVLPAFRGQVQGADSWVCCFSCWLCFLAHCLCPSTISPELNSESLNSERKQAYTTQER